MGIDIKYIFYLANEDLWKYARCLFWIYILTFGDRINRIIAQDLEHSKDEKRYFCFGRVDNEILTVRFVYRNNKIRIFGAGYWRKGKKIYEENN